jgi:hypothetical protein
MSAETIPFDRAVDHALEKLLGLFELVLGLALQRNIAKREQHCVVLVQHRAEADADHDRLAALGV